MAQRRNRGRSAHAAPGRGSRATDGRRAPPFSRLARFCVILAAAMAGAASRRSDLEPGACRGCNVLLITIDTLRRDRVGAFGSTRGLTPTLDRLATDGVRFTRAYASAPLTLPSHASILTAVSPPVHGIRAQRPVPPRLRRADARDGAEASGLSHWRVCRRLRARRALRAESWLRRLRRQVRRAPRRRCDGRRRAPRRRCDQAALAGF